MKAKQEHTITPWTLDKSSGQSFNLLDKRGSFIATLYPHWNNSDANAEYIVKACNNYEGMFNFIEMVANFRKDGETEDRKEDEEFVLENDDAYDTIMDCIDWARGLIEKLNKVRP